MNMSKESGPEEENLATSIPEGGWGHFTISDLEMAALFQEAGIAFQFVEPLNEATEAAHTAQIEALLAQKADDEATLALGSLGDEGPTDTALLNLLLEKELLATPDKKSQKKKK
jgi:hypothetical protein